MGGVARDSYLPHSLLLFTLAPELKRSEPRTPLTRAQQSYLPTIPACLDRLHDTAGRVNISMPGHAFGHTFDERFGTWTQSNPNPNPSPSPSPGPNPNPYTTPNPYPNPYPYPYPNLNPSLPLAQILTLPYL